MMRTIQILICFLYLNFHPVKVVFANDCFTLLAKFSALPDILRPAQDLSDYIEQKNSPYAKPQRLDLGNACLSDECPILGDFIEWNSDFLSLATYHQIGKPSRYESAVISLKKGDIVVFEGEEFRLGEFLGFGNATHIFALADFHDQAIRIPLLVPGSLFWHSWNNASFEIPQNGRLKIIRTLVLKYIEEAKTNERLVPIIKADPLGRYLVVKRIHIKQHANDYIRDALKTAGRNYYVPGELLSWSDLKIDSMAPFEQEKLLKLLEALRHDKATIEVIAADRKTPLIALRTVVLRQYAWDGFDWIKLDAE